jgi:glutaredoxin
MKENKNMSKATVWSKYSCTFCEQAKALLDSRNIEYEERRIGDGWTREDLLEAVPTARTVPQIFMDGKLIGGFVELREHLNQLKETA